MTLPQAPGPPRSRSKIVTWPLPPPRLAPTASRSPFDGDAAPEVADAADAVVRQLGGLPPVVGAARIALEDVDGALLEDVADLGARHPEEDGVAVHRDAAAAQLVERGAVLRHQPLAFGPLAGRRVPHEDVGRAGEELAVDGRAWRGDDERVAADRERRAEPLRGRRRAGDQLAVERHRLQRALRESSRWRWKAHGQQERRCAHRSHIWLTHAHGHPNEHMGRRSGASARGLLAQG